MPVKHAGYSFASTLERQLFDLLKLKELAGTVSDIKVQQTVNLTAAKIRYIADFSVIDNELKETVLWEAKGFQTPEWRLKKRLYEHYGIHRLRIFYGPTKPIEEIIPSSDAL